MSTHGGLLLVDDFMPFSLADVLVPGAVDVDPLPTALGIVSAELLLALAVATRVRRRMGHRRWVLLHRLNLVVWGLALLHGAMQGSDSDAGWAVVLYALTGAAVCGALAWRIVAPAPAGRPVPIRSAAGPPPPAAAGDGRYEPWPGLFDDDRKPAGGAPGRVSPRS